MDDPWFAIRGHHIQAVLVGWVASPILIGQTRREKGPDCFASGDLIVGPCPAWRPIGLRAHIKVPRLPLSSVAVEIDSRRHCRLCARRLPISGCEVGDVTSSRGILDQARPGPSTSRISVYPLHIVPRPLRIFHINSSFYCVRCSPRSRVIRLRHLFSSRTSNRPLSEPILHR